VLIGRPGKVYTRSDLSYKVQGYRFQGDGRTIDTHIKNLRKKIEPDHSNPTYVLTAVGSGYKFSFLPDEAKE
jgi:DNA-binding response OmpR family regulator